MKEIEKRLRDALLNNGKMEWELYKYEMEEHLDYWYKSLKKDKDEFLFILNERDGDVAMVLITKQKEAYINEDARQQLKLNWKTAYEQNIESLLPLMAQQISEGNLSVNGVKTNLQKRFI